MQRYNHLIYGNLHCQVLYLLVLAIGEILRKKLRKMRKKIEKIGNIFLEFLIYFF